MSSWVLEVRAPPVDAVDDAVLSPPTADHIAVEPGVDVATSRDFLLSRPPGVYTCARAVVSATKSKEYNLLIWPFHLMRLGCGLASVDTSVKENSKWTEWMRSVTTAMVLHSIQHVEKQADDVASLKDLMVAVLWWKEPSSSHASGYMISVHISEMPTPSDTGATALIRGKARENAAWKHTQWIRDRKEHEEYRNKLAAAYGTIHEVLLCEEDADHQDKLLLEGLTTNFYAVMDGKVYTADTNVLLGSTRSIVLAVCEDLEIPVVLEAPRLSECARWQAAFITSVARVGVSITRLLWESADGVIKEAQIANDCELLERIRDQIRIRQLSS